MCIRDRFNAMAWSDDAEELKHIRNDVGSQLASMECVPRHNTIDCPTPVSYTHLDVYKRQVISSMKSG